MRNHSRNSDNSYTHCDELPTVRDDSRGRSRQNRANETNCWDVTWTMLTVNIQTDLQASHLANLTVVLFNRLFLCSSHPFIVFKLSKNISWMAVNKAIV